ncbi:MAG: alpha/beta fold hydrolase [Myxococcales bacterium]|nr:alpha/beta fold hydrolase [Myxococcales bacterium]
MPQPPTISPAPYAADRGRRGVLLIHGYTGSAAETRPMGEHLAEHGWTVRCPLLPGHGTTPEALTRIDRQAWIDAVSGALDELVGRCDEVFVGGLSLGSLLTLWLGAHRPEIAGLIAMAPAIRIRSPLLPLTPIARRLLRYAPGEGGDDDLGDPEAASRGWSYDVTPLWGAAELYRLQRQVRRLLPTVRQPLLVIQGRLDRRITADAGPRLCAAHGGDDATLRWLEASGHNLLIDGERREAWEIARAWMERRSRVGG